MKVKHLNTPAIHLALLFSHLEIDVYGDDNDDDKDDDGDDKISSDHGNYFE